MNRHQTLVVAIDFSDASTDALRTAARFTRERGAHLHLLHVTNDVFRTLGVTEAPGIDWAEVQRTAIVQARHQLLELAASCGLDPRDVIVAVEVGPAASEILRYAEINGADAIVLGSHGHGVVRRFLLGSVADRVLRQATCPVVLVPHGSIRQNSPEAAASSVSMR